MIERKRFIPGNIGLKNIAVYTSDVTCSSSVFVKWTIYANQLDSPKTVITSNDALEINFNHFVFDTATFAFVPEVDYTPTGLTEA